MVDYCNDCNYYLVECPCCGELYCPECNRTEKEITLEQAEQEGV